MSNEKIVVKLLFFFLLFSAMINLTSVFRSITGRIRVQQVTFNESFSLMQIFDLGINSIGSRLPALIHPALNMDCVWFLFGAKKAHRMKGKCVYEKPNNDYKIRKKKNKWNNDIKCCTHFMLKHLVEHTVFCNFNVKWRQKHCPKKENWIKMKLLSFFSSISSCPSFYT